MNSKSKSTPFVVLVVFVVSFSTANLMNIGEKDNILIRTNE